MNSPILQSLNCQHLFLGSGWTKTCYKIFFRIGRVSKRATDDVDVAPVKSKNFKYLFKIGLKYYFMQYKFSITSLTKMLNIGYLAGKNISCEQEFNYAITVLHQLVQLATSILKTAMV